MFYYQFRPYLAESYFILYRLTGDQKYQEWAWKLATATHDICKTNSGGFSEVIDVDFSSKPSLYDYQPADFLSGTLKYLYLIFSEKTLLPLDKWIFNSRGHPLPICRANKCTG